MLFDKLLVFILTALIYSIIARLCRSIESRYDRYETIGHLLPYPEFYFTKEEISRFHEVKAAENERRSRSGSLDAHPGYYNCTPDGGYGSRDQILPDTTNHKIIRCFPDMLPFDKQNIEDVLSVMKWKNRSPALCDIVVANNRFNRKNGLANYDNSHAPVIKLIFFGGSMTKGSDTEGGCCCVDAIDSTCLSLSACRRYNGKGNDPYCGWTGHISRWFQSAFPHVNFEFVDLSDHGHTSLVSANVFGQMIDKLHTNISSRDIIFLDHSVNDGWGYEPKNKLGLETLIRAIIHNTISSDGGWPNIIVL